VLEAIRVFPDLKPALAGAELAVALTGRRPEGIPVEDVRDAAAAIAGLGRDAKAALVFGPETNGLTNDEIGLCGRAATIPADPAQPSYNLSHAVAIAAYEVRRAGRRGASRPRALATHDQKERLLELLEAGLVAVDALPRTERPSYFADWRALVQRIDLSPKELKLVEHMARKMKRAAR
jgi:tRNA/rRNA methyltransferase